MIHQYNKRDIQECLGGRRLLFVGDSTTRQVFWAVARKLDSEKARNKTIEMLENDQKHDDIQFVSNEVTLDFIWDPWLNSSALENELQLFNVDSSLKIGSAAVILLGAPGLWYARSGQENFMKDFRDAIDCVIPYMDHLPQNLSIPAHFATPQSSPNLLLFAPVQVPRYESLSSSREDTITPEKIDQMNNYLQQTSAYANADVLWSYSRMTSSGSYEYQKDGLHVIENVAAQKANVLLNLRCNNDAAKKGPPNDRTCCSDYGKTSGVQLIILVMGMLVVPGIFTLRQKGILQINRCSLPLNVLRAFTVLGLVICLCFFTDRTQLFEKAEKQFRATYFVLPCLGVALIGLVSSRRSNSPVTKSKASPKPPKFYILSRDQTDEWKGWMQAFILIYHYSHGSQTLWIYEIVRLLVASYLFMTGYGHTLYFLQNQDYSMSRLAGILIRLNLLSSVLPYMMGTDYMFYYFMPLVSFWFIVVYITLRTGRESNGDLSFLFGKILFSCILTTTCTMIPGVWDSVFVLLRYTCKIHWDSQEWRFRIFLDMYIVYVGMIMAILVHHSSKFQKGLVMPKSALYSALTTILARPGLYKIITSVMSVMMLWSYWVFREQFSRKEDYNLWQPYISFIPILGFVGLRNSLQIFRNYHSLVFAWLGRCSLETFILQYHMWLAADTKGLLRIGLWNEGSEIAVLTIVFLWLGHCTANATQTLTAWIVGAPKLSARTHCEKEGSRCLPSTENWGSLERNDETPHLRWKLGLLIFGLWFGNMMA